MKPATTARPALTLLGMEIREPPDFLRLIRYINAFRHEEDPKERRDDAYVRCGMACDPRFCAWKGAVTEYGKARIYKYDVFSSADNGLQRISLPKVSAYMAGMLPRVVDFIQGRRAGDDVLASLFELSQFVRYFFPHGKRFAVDDGVPLLGVLAAMRAERGRAWASQLRWFLRGGCVSEVRRSFYDRWPQLQSCGGGAELL